MKLYSHVVKNGSWVQEGRRRLCDLGRLGTVVLPLGRVALDFSRGRLGLLVEVWAGLGFLQSCVVLFSSQEFLHAILQQLHVRLVTVLLQTTKETGGL